MTRDAVDRLRRMAAERDWNGCDDALRAALGSVESADQLALAEETLRRGLPIFERNHPGQSWPRDALDGRTDELPPECEGPGGNAFTTGVLALVDARRSVDDSTARRDFVVDALGEAIMAERCAIWGEQHPERWRQWYEAMADGQPLGGNDPMRGWYRDPAVINRERELWADLADRLEALIG